jgi:hypothetical protein
MFLCVRQCTRCIRHGVTQRFFSFLVLLLSSNHLRTAPNGVKQDGFVTCTIAATDFISSRHEFSLLLITSVNDADIRQSTICHIFRFFFWLTCFSSLPAPKVVVFLGINLAIYGFTSIDTHFFIFHVVIFTRISTLIYPIRALLYPSRFSCSLPV